MSSRPRRAHTAGGVSPAAGSAATATESAATAAVAATTDLCPIVGIGASAGGLEALGEFLRHVPDKTGMAFVVVQHLDPTHKGAMVELLQRVSKIRVVEITDRCPVEPDRVYVIPPGMDISILHGVLHLAPLVSPRGLNLPIDHFFRSLAEDRQDGSIGVVLSGMGSDGTLGLRAIKEKAGATFVQSPASAKFDGMPRSAIDAHLADVVAPARELPARIIAYRKHAPSTAGREAVEPPAKQQSALEKILILLRNQCGNDFSLYKRSTIERRIERRMGLHQIDTIGGYVRYLRDDPREVELLFKELLIGVTSFFRDPAAWDHLRKLVPELLRAHAQGGVVRAWVPACSTGEEAYSLAMVLSEAMDEAKPSPKLSYQIFATDLDRDAIEQARAGVYPPNVAADLSPERLSRFFHKDDRGFRVRKEIRDAIVFAPQNLITEPPFTKLDILSCRNVLIYFSAELQKKLIPLFHYSLNPRGLLFLGSAETIGGFSNLFEALDGKARVYRRLDASIAAPAVEFPSAFVSREAPAPDRAPDLLEPVRATPASLQQLADRVIVQRFSPAAVLSNERGDILYISARTGKYLEPAVGKASLNLFAMAREGLRHQLSRAFAAALRGDRPVTVRGIKVSTNGTTQLVDLSIQRLVDPVELRGMVITVIADVDAAAHVIETTKPARVSTNRRVPELAQELQLARDEAQTVREEMQTSQEELKSANEELQSTNEELQSTNEELTTSKEEMQSMNEELQTVNQELQSKMDDLARSNNDMRNLLNSTEIATLFLDSELGIRRFTSQTTKIIKLLPSDTGRPITDIATDLVYPALPEDAREVLRTLVFKETQVATRDGRWYTVRIMPYRTIDNMIDGVVITFSDTTSAKQLEVTLRDQSNQLRQMAASPLGLFWECAADGACTFLSPELCKYTGGDAQADLGYGWLAHVHPDDRERFRTQWQGVVKDKIGPLDIELRLRAKDGTFRWFATRLVPIRDERGAVVKWYGTHIDVDKLKRSEQVATVRLSRMREWVDEPAFLLDVELQITTANAAAARMLGQPVGALVGKSLLEVLPGARDTKLGTKIEDAIRAHEDQAFDVRFEHGPHAGTYHVLALPVREGVTLLIRRERPPAGGNRNS